jgi:hypothetical protein
MNTTTKPFKRSKSTPWGVADGHIELADGVHRFTTPSHGGFHVSSEVRNTWPAPLRDFEPFAGQGWYEEDCDWAIVAVAMPSLFTADHVAQARRTIKSLGL